MATMTFAQLFGRNERCPDDLWRHRNRIFHTLNVPSTTFRVFMCDLLPLFALVCLQRLRTQTDALCGSVPVYLEEVDCSTFGIDLAQSEGRFVVEISMYAFHCHFAFGRRILPNHEQVRQPTPQRCHPSLPLWRITYLCQDTGWDFLVSSSSRGRRWHVSSLGPQTLHFLSRQIF